MATKELFNVSDMESLYRYFITRFRWPVMVVLPCFLAFLSALAIDDLTLSRQFGNVVVVLALIIPFRLADDLADRRVDRSENPERELCTTHSLRNYIGALVALSLIAIIVVTTTRGHIAITLFFAAALVSLLWYRMRDSFRTSRIVNYHVVLLKYPVFVLVLIDPKAWEISVKALWSGATAYVLLLIWEVIHDKRYRSSITARRIAVIELVAWLACTMWLVSGR